MPVSRFPLDRELPAGRAVNQNSNASLDAHVSVNEVNA